MLTVRTPMNIWVKHEESDKTWYILPSNRYHNPYPENSHTTIGSSMYIKEPKEQAWRREKEVQAHILIRATLHPTRSREVLEFFGVLEYLGVFESRWRGAPAPEYLYRFVLTAVPGETHPCRSCRIGIDVSREEILEQSRAQGRERCRIRFRASPKEGPSRWREIGVV